MQVLMENNHHWSLCLMFQYKHLHNISCGGVDSTTGSIAVFDVPATLIYQGSSNSDYGHCHAKVCVSSRPPFPERGQTSSLF